jgi:hypothetical protein
VGSGEPGYVDSLGSGSVDSGSAGQGSAGQASAGSEPDELVDVRSAADEQGLLGQEPAGDELEESSVALESDEQSSAGPGSIGPG